MCAVFSNEPKVEIFNVFIARHVPIINELDSRTLAVRLPSLSARVR